MKPSFFCTEKYYVCPDLAFRPYKKAGVNTSAFYVIYPGLLFPYFKGNYKCMLETKENIT